jgi:outer membrane lipoprotein LolB
MVVMRFLFLFLSFALLSGCTELPIKSDVSYKAAEKSHLYKIKQWSFSGRLSLSDGRESWSAAVVWAHTGTKDEIKLSGPLGQGAAVITLIKDSVTIDRGDDKPKQSAQVDEFIQKQLGVFVPVSALRYWVLGLPNPSGLYTEKGDGFKQANWDVHYLQLQNLGTEWMPRKIGVEQGDAKLKLIIDEWTI